MALQKRVSLVLVLIVLCIPLGCGDEPTAPDPLPPGEAGHVLAGLVRNPGGQALKDAVVTLETVTDGVVASVQAQLRPNEVAAKLDVRATVSDATGRFAFDDVAPGAYALEARTRDHLAFTEQFEILNAAAAETTFVDIDLTPTGTFTGVALLENASDHSSTTVFVEGTSYTSDTDPAGNYSITGVPIGTWAVRGHHAGYLDDTTSGMLAAAGDTTALATLNLPLNSNIPPVATAFPANAVSSLIPVGLDGTGTDADGTVVSFEWDFEDDGTFDYSSPTSAATTHLYAGPGTYRAKLRVTDDKGAIGLDVTTFTLVANQPPTAMASVPTESVAGLPTHLSGTGSDPDGTIVLFEWDFENDGGFDYSSPDSAGVDHVYPAEGTVTAVLRVTDDLGATDSDSVTFDVESTTIFVSNTSGNDGNPGTASLPVATIQKGLDLAESGGKTQVLVTAETYAGVLDLKDGIDLVGGRSTFDWSQTGVHTTAIVPYTGATATSITSATRVEWVRFSAPTPPVPDNSVALFALNSSALTFEQCEFLASDGGLGADGAVGPVGSSGGAGDPGEPGMGDNDTIPVAGGAGGTSVACVGGRGGNGREEDRDGDPGLAGACGGGNGGQGGQEDQCDPGGPGQNGFAGSDGSAGLGGSPASPAGNPTSTGFMPHVSGDGQPGGPGSGGGGGGGGAGQGGLFCQDGTGNGGGGGGGGGEGGGGGAGGQGGYGSFGVYLWNSSALFDNCLFRSLAGGIGGNGGDGGNGGTGGDGGLGGTADLADVGAGGDGGTGGDGGGGGGGAGGPGGPSYGIFGDVGSTATMIAPTFNIGPGGQGGFGGATPGGSPAPDGAAGDSGNTNLP